MTQPKIVVQLEGVDDPDLEPYIAIVLVCECGGGHELSDDISLNSDEVQATIVACFECGKRYCVILTPPQIVKA